LSIDATLAEIVELLPQKCMVREGSVMMPNGNEVLDRLGQLAHGSTIERNRRNGMQFVPGRRSGLRLYELGGSRELIDCTCSGGVFNLGHANPEVTAVMRQALDAGLDGGIWFLPNVAALDLAEAVAKAMPTGFPDRAVVTHSSTASIDLALMVAMRETGRTKILACRNAYHGHTGFAALVTGSATDGVADHYKLPRGMAAFFEFGDAAELAERLDGSVAAVILEPMCYETFEPADAEFMAALYRLCRDNGTLVIFDETRTGLGRTGPLWAAESFSGAPDLMIVGKGLSGGLYPVSLCVMTEPLYASSINGHDYGYSSSLAGNEIACTVARRVLEISQRPQLLDNARDRARQATDLIAGLTRRFQGVILGGGANGLAIHIRLADPELAAGLYKACFDGGLLCHSVSTARGPMIKLMPPLIVTEAELADIFSRLECALEKLIADPAVASIASGA
jgi:putrescine aminotransferase